MDFLSAKTLEGKLWVTFHIDKYGRRAWGWRGGHAWETEAETETIVQKDKGREI